ncbi:MAG: phosphatase PAP2 family protein [Janthinobacterium lividum]
MENSRLHEQLPAASQGWEKVAVAGRRHPFLAFTALTLVGCLVLVWWLDKPLALFLHRYATGTRPFFEAVTNAADTAYGATIMHNWLGWPVLFWVLGLGYVLGRWLLRQRAARVLLVMLLTHVSSEITANVIKVLTHRQRPQFLAGGGDAGGSFGSSGPDWDSFPSAHTAIYWGLFWPLALAFPRWRRPLLVLPVLISLERLVVGVHYLSDVWAAIWLVVAWTLLFRLLRRWL